MVVFRGIWIGAERDGWNAGARGVDLGDWGGGGDEFWIGVHFGGAGEGGWGIGGESGGGDCGVRGFSVVGAGDCDVGVGVADGAGGKTPPYFAGMLAAACWGCWR